MSFARWWLVFAIATLGVVAVMISAGDFDALKYESQRRAAIEQARRASGVDGRLTPAPTETRHGY